MGTYLDKRVLKVCERGSKSFDRVNISTLVTVFKLVEDHWVDSFCTHRGRTEPFILNNGP